MLRKSLVAFLLVGSLIIPSRIASQAVTSLQPNVNGISINNATMTGSTIDGAVFALPSNVNQMVWQYSFGSAPSSVTISLRTSLDNINYSSLDVGSNTAGELRTVVGGAKFARCRLNGNTGGTTVTCSLTVQVIPTASTGQGGTLMLTAVGFASLGTPPNGTIIYCNTCTIANPCAGAGTGAIAKRLNSIWVCN